MKLNHPLLIVAGLSVLYYLLFVCTYSFNTCLGKMAIVGSVLVVSHRYGKVAGLVSAAVAVLLLHRSIEGVDDTLKVDASGNGEAGTEEGETEEGETEEGENGEGETGEGETEEQDAQEQEQKASAVSVNSVVDLDEKMRPKTTLSSEETTLSSEEAFTLIGTGLQNEPMALNSSSQEYASF